MTRSPARNWRWHAFRRWAALGVASTLLATSSASSGAVDLAGYASGTWAPGSWAPGSWAPTNPVAGTAVAVTSDVSGASLSTSSDVGSTPDTWSLAGVIKNVPFARPVGCELADCSVQLDMFIPAGTGPFRTAVMVRGGPTGPGGRHYVEPLVEELVGEGFIVFNADYRDIAATGGGYPAAFEDVACAVRFARTWSSAYGGDSQTVTLVGHSLGGYVGSVLALGSQKFQGGCPSTVSGRPDAFVGLAGNYDLTASSVANDLTKFFGGDATETAEARAESDPFADVTAASIPVRLIAGTADHTVNPAAAVSLDDYLTQRLWNVKLTLIPNATHDTIIRPTGDGPISARVVLEASKSASG